MDFKQKLKYSGLCLGIAVLAFSPSEVKAFNDEADTTVITIAPTCTPTIVTPMNFGTSYMAISMVGTTAYTTLSTAGTLTTPLQVAGQARLVALDTTGVAALNFTVAGGAPSAVMSLQISNTADTVNVTLDDGVPTDAQFTVNNWTAALAAGAGNGTISTALSAVTGIGGITLSSTGTINLNFGARMSTDNSGFPYAVDGSTPYTGTIRVTVNY